MGHQRESMERVKKVVKASEAAEKMLTSIQNLIDHLSRNKEIKGVIKQKREEALEKEGHAMTHMDWVENYL